MDNDNYHNEYDGTDVGVTYDGLSGNFDGTTYYTNSSFPQANTFTEMSYSFWVKPSTFDFGTDDGGNIFNLDLNNGFRVRLNATTGIVSSLINAGDNILNGSALTLDTWYHIVVTANSAGTIIYIDNNLDVSNSVPWAVTVPAVHLLVVGRYNETSGEYFTGNIARMRVYDKTLTLEQVEVIYNTEKGDFE